LDSLRRFAAGWSHAQIDLAHQHWLLVRARGDLDALGVAVRDHESSAVLVCAREGERRVLIAADWSPDASWLREKRASILRVAASCCDELRFLSRSDYEELLEELLWPFEGVESVVDAAVRFHLRELDQASARVMVCVDEGEEPELGLGALDDWLAGDAQAALVSGAFGAGKSTLVAQWCQHRWREDGPRPLLANLATGEHGDPLGLLLGAAGRDPSAEAERAALTLLLHSRRVIACFDGFDEMVTRLSFSDIPARMAELLEVAGKTGKVLVASRDHYFSSADAVEQDMRKALLRADVRGLVQVRLQPFGAAQVTELVDEFIAEPERRAEVLAKIRTTYDLVDLVQTPMLLSMVLQTIDELALDARVGSASVYERYLQRFLDHAERGDKELFSPEDKLAFAEILAGELWRRGEHSLGWAQLHDSVMAGLYAALPSDAPPESAYLEIRGGSFFVRDAEGRFRFAHKSFLEFFLAKGLLAGLLRNPEQILDTARLTPEVAAFVAELLRARGTGAEDPAIAALQRWLVTGREARLKESRGAAANALRLLRDVAREFDERAGWVPEHADLRGVELLDEELGGLRLRGARFGRAQLAGVDFRDADLREASFQDALLSHARFWRTQLDRVCFDRADMTGIEGHESSLRGASLRKVQMQGSTWMGCEWGETKVEGATIGPTIVTDLDPGEGGLRVPAMRIGVGLEAGHGAAVLSVAWSPDGQRLASASFDHSVRIWTPHDGRCLVTLRGHSNAVDSVAWSADGQRLASASIDNSVRIWDPHDSRCLATLQGHSHVVTSVAWSADGQRLASASIDGSIRIWDRDGGRCLVTVQNHSNAIGRGRDGVASVAWSADGQRLASASHDHSVRIWQPDNGRCLAILQGHSSGVASVAWSADGQRLASASFDNSVRIWNPHDGRCLATLQGDSGVASVAWSADRQRLASASYDGSVRIWDPHDGRCLATLQGHSDWVNSVAWSADGQRLASASHDHSVRIWDRDDGRCLATLQGHFDWVASVTWSADGQRFASTSFDHSVRIWEPNNGRCLATLQGHSDWVKSVAWSADGQCLASASFDHSVRIWDPHEGRLLATLEGHSGGVNSVAWSADSQRLASASFDNSVCIWTPHEGRVVATLKGHSKGVNSVAWSADDQRLASASHDHSVRIWDPDDGRRLVTLEGHSNGVTSVAWSADGRRLASASTDKSVRIWDPQDGRCVATFLGHSNGVTSVAWSADDKRLASASDDGSVRIWDPRDGRCVATLHGHSDKVNSVAWSADGQRLASASRDRSVRIWHMAPPVELHAHTKAATAVSFAPDGARFVSGSHDHSIRTFDALSHAELAQTERCDARLFALSHAPSGEQLASASRDGRVRLWNPDTLAHVRTLHGHTREATCVAYSPDGTLLASGSADRALRLWNPTTGEALGTATHGHWVNCVAFSPDGRTLLAGTSDNDLRLWSVPDLRELRRIDAHSHYVTGVAWYPDGTRFVSSSWDHRLRVWDARTGVMLHQIDGHTHYVSAVAFAPDGTRFASAGADETLRIWDAQTFACVARFGAERWLRSVAWSPDSTQIIATSEGGGIHVWRVEPCLAILEAHGSTSLARTPSGQFCLDPEDAAAWLEVPRPESETVFHLPLAGVRQHQSREAVTHALAGRPTASLAQSLGWAPLAWDGEVRSWSRTPPRRQPRLASVPGKIDTNPFWPETALPGVDELPGRRVAIDSVVQVLRRRGSALLRGPRRAGKTSLLHYLRHYASDHTVLSASLQSGPARTPDELSRLLLPALADASAPAEALLRHLEEVGGERPVLIMLDEVGKLVDAESETFEWLRAIGQELAAVVYSGSHHDWVGIMRRVRSIPGSSFGNDITMVDLGPLPETDALDFLTSTAPAEAPISRTLAGWAVQESGAWPYYLQVLGFALVQAQTVFERAPTTMSRGDFHEFYREQLLREKSHYFQLRWDEFTARARSILLELLEPVRASRPLALANWLKLSRPQKRELRDNGALVATGWALDKPFLEWMGDNYELLDDDDLGDPP